MRSEAKESALVEIYFTLSCDYCLASRIAISLHPAVMKPPIIKCSCCSGTGKVPLSAPLLETLAVVPSDDFMSTQDIVTRLKIKYVKPTAINNRLRLGLLPLGLVECHRRGKSMFWKRTK